MIELIVHMDCSGCEYKIRKALQKLKGVDNVEIDMNMQKVTVMGWADQDSILESIRKTGRKADLWPYSPEAQHNAAVRDYYYYDSNNINNNNNHQYDNHILNHDHHYYESPSVMSYNYLTYSVQYDDDVAVQRHDHHSPPYYSAQLYHHAADIFSDENPHACSIM